MRPSASSFKEIPIPIEEFVEEPVPVKKVRLSSSSRPESGPLKAMSAGSGTVESVWIWQETEDCLWNIAQKHYGNPYLWPRIFEANKDLIENPHVIFPKQKLRIPTLGKGERRLAP